MRCIGSSFACFCIALVPASTLVPRILAILGFGTCCSASLKPTLFLGRRLLSSLLTLISVATGPIGPNQLASCALVASSLRCRPAARARTCINPGAWFTMSVLCASPPPWRRLIRPCCANVWRPVLNLHPRPAGCRCRPLLI